MATAHLHAQVISRGSGHQAVAKAAYNARAVLEDERYGQTHDFSRHRSRCLFEGIYAPRDAPEWTRDRAQLWNHVEAFEKHRRAELAREIELGLPHELTLDQNRWLLQDWIRENFTRKGLIVDAAIHEPGQGGDRRNVHAHVMIVMRKLDGSEFARTKERFDTFSEKQRAKEADLMALRQSWEALANRHLERHGHEARIDMGRKEDGEATVHLGRHASAMERQGRASELGDHNRAVEAENARLKALMRDQARQAANENEPSPGNAERSAEPDPAEADRREPDFIDASRKLAAALRGFAENDRAMQASRDLSAALRSFAQEDRQHVAEREAHRSPASGADADMPQQCSGISSQSASEPSRLREFVRAGWEIVTSLAQRMEAAWDAIRNRYRHTEPEKSAQRPRRNPLRLKPDTAASNSYPSLIRGELAGREVRPGQHVRSAGPVEPKERLGPDTSKKGDQCRPSSQHQRGSGRSECDEERRKRRYADLLAEALAKQQRARVDTGPTFGM